MTNLEALYLERNGALQKSSRCPLDERSYMSYNGKEKVTEFLRCIA